MKDLNFLNDKKVFSQKYTVEMYNASYFKTIRLAYLFRYLQEVAGQHSEAMKVGYDDLKANNGGWVLVKQLLEIERLPEALEEFTVYTWSNKHNRAVANRSFLVTDSAGKMIAKASSDWVVLDFTKRRIIPLNKIDMSSTESFKYEIFDQDLTKIELNKGKLVNSFVKKIRFTDIDIMGHMNNTCYVDLVIDSMAEVFSERHTLKSINTNFIQEVKFNDEIIINSYQSGDNVFHHQILRVNDEIEVFTAETVWTK